MPVASTKIERVDINKALFAWFDEKYGVNATRLFYETDAHGVLRSVKFEYDLIEKENVE